MNLADKKAKEAKLIEDAYRVGWELGRALSKYVLPWVVTYTAVKYGVRSAMKGKA